MHDFILKEISSDYILNELHQIGFDEGYRFVAQDKFKYKNIKIYNLTPAQANIIKQTALTVGADCATHREVIRGGVEYSDAILGGNIAQLKKIADKLKYQPFSLGILSENITKQIQPRKTKTKIVGILNITPDSFSDGGEYFKPENAIKHFNQMLEDGADIIDIGAESTRPNSAPVPADEQIFRIKPLLEYIRKENVKIQISIDTRSSCVAEFALNNGADIINDVSGGEYDENMFNIVAQYNVPIIIQHTKGNPQNMQDNPKYENLIDEIFFSLKSKIEKAESLGITQIIADPGIGFGKTREHNLEILNRIEEFYSLNKPIMAGLSRKSFLGINESPNEIKDALSLAFSYPLVQKGVDYLRVHNVKLHKYLVR